MNDAKLTVSYPVKSFLLLCAVWTLASPAAAFAHVYVISSPTHEQTFAYGSERHQAWAMRGPDRHLALNTEFTNDPYVDRSNPRQYDDFVFNFPNVRLGADGVTFYYHAPNGRRVPVATRHKDFLGISEIHLLDGSQLYIKKPHGYLTLGLVVVEPSSATSTASL